MLIPEPYIRLLKFYITGFTIGYITISGLLKISEYLKSKK
jgi:hypothetical protein